MKSGTRLRGDRTDCSIIQHAAAAAGRKVTNSVPSHHATMQDKQISFLERRILESCRRHERQSLADTVVTAQSLGALNSQGNGSGSEANPQT